MDVKTVRNIDLKFFFYNKVDVLRLKSECDLLRGEKRALKESVEQEIVKRICLEDKLQSALEKAGKLDRRSQQETI